MRSVKTQSNQESGVLTALVAGAISDYFPSDTSVLQRRFITAVSCSRSPLTELAKESIYLAGPNVPSPPQPNGRKTKIEPGDFTMGVIGGGSR